MQFFKCLFFLMFLCYANNECLWVQWYKYFHDVKDEGAKLSGIFHLSPNENIYSIAQTVQANCRIRQSDFSGKWLPDLAVLPIMLCSSNFFNLNFKNQVYYKIIHFCQSMSCENNSIHIWSWIYLIWTCSLILLVTLIDLIILLLFLLFFIYVPAAFISHFGNNFLFYSW